MISRKNISQKGKLFLLCGVFLFLFIPLIQEVTHVKKYITPLDGAFVKQKDVTFSWNAWFNGDYQEQKDKFINQNFGFHNYYIRLICHINFLLFHKANASYVVVGKHNYLYETGYIDAYYGRDFIGEQRIKNYVKKLKTIQDTLEERNKLIVVVFAPGKAGFYPEYIPTSFSSRPHTTNYACFLKEFKREKINHIDFNKFFIDQKYQSKYPLYPQFGVHWSNYGSAIAYDSVLKYFENKLCINLPDLKFRRIDQKEIPEPPDDDIVKSLNLFIQPKTFKMAYPRMEVEYDPLKHKKVNLLVIADSYWWHIYHSHIPDSSFATSRFWYYNKEMYPESNSNPTYVSQIDYACEIKKADIIMILHSELTLSKFGNGFVDMCYETYCHPGLIRAKIQKMKESIRATPEWFEQIIKKAHERNISVDSMLTTDAIYTLEQLKK